MRNFNNLLCYLIMLSIFLPAFTNLIKSQSNSTEKVSYQGLAEGGSISIASNAAKDETHSSREHENNLNKLSPSNLNNTQSNMKVEDVNNSTLKLLPTKSTEIEGGVPKKNDEKQSVAKKGVNFTASDTDGPSKETSSVIMNSTTTAVSKVKTESTTIVPVPRKPLHTEHDDFITNDVKPKSSNIDTLLEKKSKRADYVIPIVAVILSVPLVAIIISFVYKRGTDWWQHRNYRRMDFLIEGMYNN